MQEVRYGVGRPFRPGGRLYLNVDPPVEMMTPKEFADTAYMFMTGIPGFGSRGFAMMDPGTLKKQRLTYVRYWSKLLVSDIKRVAEAAKK